MSCIGFIGTVMNESLHLQICAVPLVPVIKGVLWARLPLLQEIGENYAIWAQVCYHPVRESQIA